VGDLLTDRQPYAGSFRRVRIEARELLEDERSLLVASVSIEVHCESLSVD